MRKYFEISVSYSAPQRKEKDEDMYLSKLIF